MKRLFRFVCIAVAAITIISCSKDNNDEGISNLIVGAWESTHYYDSEYIDPVTKEYGKMIEIEDEADIVVVKFFNGGTFYIENTYLGDYYGTYMLDGRTITTEIEDFIEDVDVSFYVWGVNKESAYLTVKVNGELLEDVMFNRKW